MWLVRFPLEHQEPSEAWTAGRGKFLDFFRGKLLLSGQKGKSRVGRARVLTFLVKLRVATELIRTAAPVRPVVEEQEVEKIGPQPGNTPLIRRE